MRFGTEITPSLEGIPFPIILSNQPPGTADSRETFHHHFHPEADPRIKGDVGLAVRFCRGQDLQRWLHRRAHQTFRGPALPSVTTDKIDIVLRACAGDVPYMGIEFDQKGDFAEVVLTEQERQKFIDRHNIHIEDADSTPAQQRFVRNKIGLLIALFCAEQDLNLSDTLVDQFMNGTDPTRTLELGNQFLAHALMEVVRPIEQKRNELLKSGMFWQMGNVTSLYSLAKDYFVKERFIDYHVALRRKLGGDALQTEVNEVELVGH